MPPSGEGDLPLVYRKMTWYQTSPFNDFFIACPKMTQNNFKKWVWLSPWKFLIWHGVDGGGDDGGKGRKWSWPADAIEIFSWWHIWPRRNRQRSLIRKPDWSIKTRVIERQSSDLRVVVGLRPLAVDCVGNAFEFTLRPQAQMREALWLRHVTFSSSICEGEPKNTTKPNERKKTCTFPRKRSSSFFFRAPPSEELDSYYIWI